MLSKRLEAAYRGSKFHSFLNAVKGLSPEEALWKPTQYSGFPWMDGSIQNIIFHVGGDSLYQLDYALGECELTWAELQQQFEQAGGHLTAALQLADQGYHSLQNALASIDDSQLSEIYPTPEGKGDRSVSDFFWMMIEHHIYHAGQIVYIRSMFKALNKKGA